MLALLNTLFLLAPQDLPSTYDSTWGGAPSTAEGLEQVMLAEDKLYVVLGVVLIIWLGILFFLYRNDRHIRALERNDEHASVEP